MIPQRLLPNRCTVFREYLSGFSSDGEQERDTVIIYENVPCSIQRQRAGGRFLSEEAGSDDQFYVAIYMNLEYDIKVGDKIRIGSAISGGFPYELPIMPPTGDEDLGFMRVINVIDEAGRYHHRKIVCIDEEDYAP